VPDPFVHFFVTQGDANTYMREQSVNIMVRRNYIYEDAFEKLSPENEPNLRLKMRVHLINVAGKLSFLDYRKFIPDAPFAPCVAPPPKKKKFSPPWFVLPNSQNVVG
jgi:hypothetical protein